MTTWQGLKEAFVIIVLPVVAVSLFGLGISTHSSSSPATYSITGIASSKAPSADGLTILPSAFDESIAALAMGNKRIPLLIDHGRNIASVIGVVTKIWIENNELYFSARVVENNSTRWVIDKLLTGELTSVSIGFDIVDMEGIQATEVNLLEISIVWLGKDPQARITEVMYE